MPMIDDGKSVVIVYVPLVHPGLGVWARLIAMDEEFCPLFGDRLTQAGYTPLWLNISETMKGTSEDHRFIAQVMEILYRKAGDAMLARQAISRLVQDQETQ